MAPPDASDAPDLDAIAREGLDLDRLRPGQREAAEAAVAGRDVLAVMPTGYGKSAVYKLVAAAVEGCTVVVSPLVALQRDQVGAIEDDDVGEAVQVDASVGETARAEAFARLTRGEIEFVFLAPEQLARPDTIEALRAARPSVFVVDEAHCISAWGHDFRPDYQRLGDVVEALGHPVTLALTATAAPPVRAEIVERLGLRDPVVVVRGFDRPNIHLAVERHLTADDKDAAVVGRAVALAAGRSSGIVYVGTRARAEALAGAIEAGGVPAAAYHAGLPRTVRDEVHDRFLEGDARVVVATTAFGMGIDKPDVRFVLHAEVAESLDAYYQEVGRAGRDGEPADAVLFYRPEDMSLRRFLGAGGSPKPDVLGAVLACLHRLDGGRLELPALREQAGEAIGPRRVTQALNVLADVGVVEVDGAAGWVALADGGEPDLEAVVAAVAARDDERKALAASRLEMVRSYAEGTGCRRRALLTYFGEPDAGPCGHCDTCDAGVVDDAVPGDGPFTAGMRVAHEAWGEGQVLRIEGDVVVVLFDREGYRNLSVDAVVERGLLVALD